MWRFTNCVPTVGELAHQRVAGACPHLGEDRTARCLALPHPLHEDPVEVRAGRRGDLGHPRLLRGARAVGQHDAELVGDLADLDVELRVLGAEAFADLAHGGRAGLLRGLLAGGVFPEARLVDLHEQVAVGGSERAPLGLLSTRRYRRRRSTTTGTS